MSAPSTILGGWAYDGPAHGERHLFAVTIRTSIDNWEEYVLARDRKELDTWIAAKYPHPSPGYEPLVNQLDCGLDSIHLLP